ncbi:hypothetical protein [Rhizobium leguminosarum]|uniref:hypothetical protein n=1 Tax=Rhizobium leguminosarum TaxID=384 RepID=UPI0010404A63|nr:hypothetical protein [Rhizobium leguminosarum]TBY81701.1 hypothetical protein E0H32_15560 [Rhizobium leguminosarum bv. viciae]
MLRFVASAGFALLVAQTGHAAEIKVITPDPIPQARIVRGECSASLTGLIEAGDAQKIEAIDAGGMETRVRLSFAAESSASDEDPPPMARALCLTDSEGGNFEEALKIAEYLRSSGWVAVVPRNGRCLSACAIAFLGGALLSSNSDGGERAPFRVMDVSATVGFHAPLFPEGMDPDAKVPMSLALEFLRDGMASIQELRATLTEDDFPSAGATLPATLMLDMLSHAGNDDFGYVDTVDKAGAYNIRLAGVPTIPIDAEALYRLCNNAVNWAFGLHSRGDAALTSWSYKLCKHNEDDGAECAALGTGKALIHNLRAGVTVQSRHHICSIEGGPNPGDDYQVTSQRVNGAEFERSFEPWATLPHYMPLADLARMRGSIDVRAYRELQPSSQYDAGSLSLSAFLKALPGNVLVIDGKEESTESLIINFSKNGTAEILWPEGSIDRTPYTLTEDGACFTKVKASSGRVCARMKVDKESDSWNWSFSPLYPDVLVRFQRPGRVVPPDAR